MLDTFNLAKLDPKQMVQLRTLTDHPLRLKLFQELRYPMTAAEAAAVLGVKRTSLYYHLQVLLKNGLIEEVETRKVRHLTESVYKRAVERIDFTRSNYEDPGPSEPYFRMIMGITQGTTDDCMRSLIRGGNLKAATTRVSIMISSDSLETIPKKISKLMREFTAQVKELDEEAGNIEYSVIVTHFEM